MSFAKHNIQILEFGSAQSSNSDRVILGQILSVANAAGTGAGATVSTVVTFLDPLPPSYGVVITPNQAAVAWVSAKTTFGFTVNLAPLLPATTLSAGAIDVTIVA
jgi:hypothetical protein